MSEKTNIISSGETYVICYDLSQNVLHLIRALENQVTSTGLSNFEIFFTEQEAYDRIDELGFDHNNYIPQDNIFIPEEDLFPEYPDITDNTI